ncbi:MAG: 4Fe-4S dicluster domain-containing protein [Chloroflexi bacterium]|nr:4Fe-4S dicluster domain-containing protein [Chloroflexota bacterium]
MADHIVDRVRSAGVVGAGGAGFPTHVKLAAKVDTVIANGAECEPLLHADRHLMTRHPDEILRGLSLAMEATGATRGIVALKAAYHDARAGLEAALPRYKNVTLCLLGSYYPAGDEFILVYEATGRKVPEGGIPLEVGAVVNNVGTLYNVARAQDGQPVTHRYMTVTGEVKSPATLRLPIGVNFAQVVEWVGGYTKPVEDLALVAGGAMMGRVVTPDDVVTKTTGGLLVLPKDNVVVQHMTRPLNNAVRRGRSTCDQCRDCTDLCPRYLLGHALQPHDIMRNLNYGLTFPTEIVTAAVLCCECRLCEAYACPLELSPIAYYRAVKSQLRAAGWKNVTHRRKDYEPHPFFDFRRVPVSRLIDKLGLTKYKNYDVPLDERDLVPPSVCIPLRQHTGVPAKPVVRVGDRVKVGDLVAEIPQGALGANVHASIAGKVSEVTEEYIRVDSC